MSVIGGQRDPPETATPKLDVEVTGVDDEAKPDELEVDEDEVELDVVVLAAAEAVAVPGVV